jgi:flagellar biosynthesis/type III secretory pathway M-ring protein FliF/YscJ
VTASITVLPKTGQTLSDEQKRSIMRHVEKSFAGLKYEDISISDLSNGSNMTGATDPMSAEDQK